MKQLDQIIETDFANWGKYFSIKAPGMMVSLAARHVSALKELSVKQKLPPRRMSSGAYSARVNLKQFLLLISSAIYLLLLSFVAAFSQLFLNSHMINIDLPHF